MIIIKRSIKSNESLIVCAWHHRPDEGPPLRLLGSTLATARSDARMTKKNSARNDPPAEGRGLSRAGSFRRSDCGYAEGVAATVFFIHSVVTLLGRSRGAPIARLMTSCDSMPIARETENSTV